MNPTFALAAGAVLCVITLAWLLAFSNIALRVRVWALYQRSRLLLIWGDHQIQRAAAGHPAVHRSWVARMLGAQ